MHARSRGTVPANDHLAFAPLPSAVSCARLHARLLMKEWDLGCIADEVELIVSELVTNAVRASAALPGRPPLTLDLRTGEKSLTVEVRDRSPLEPVLREAGSGDVRGRGLMIVEAYSARWGWDRLDREHKCVWAEIDLPQG